MRKRSPERQRPLKTERPRSPTRPRDKSPVRSRLPVRGTRRRSPEYTRHRSPTRQRSPPGKLSPSRSRLFSPEHRHSTMRCQRSPSFQRTPSPTRPRAPSCARQRVHSPALPRAISPARERAHVHSSTRGNPPVLRKSPARDPLNAFSRERRRDPHSRRDHQRGQLIGTRTSRSASGSPPRKRRITYQDQDQEESTERLRHSSITGRDLLEPKEIEQTAERLRRSNQDSLLQRALTSRPYKPPAPQQEQQPRKTPKQAPAAKTGVSKLQPFQTKDRRHVKSSRGGKNPRGSGRGRKR
ncbi:serine/arginine repetitive matrix protein 1-like [Palaemon carinicauda]|uniref:serine/arginine repetitive matrix protein 1-like n=1 Tax=Palaemon carinicauda TaxID=392227 RepID=UPI0035B67E2F